MSEIADLSAAVAGALFLAEGIGLVIARRELGSQRYRALAPGWHQRIEILTPAVLGALQPVLLVVLAIIAGAVLGAATA